MPKLRYLTDLETMTRPQQRALSHAPPRHPRVYPAEFGAVLVEAQARLNQR